MFRLFLFVLIFLPKAVFSLPIDWHGVFGVDTTLINNYNRIEPRDESADGNDGSQEISLGDVAHTNASWQSYLFKLIPVLIVNDAATIKSELSTRRPRGGRFGDSMFQSGNPGMGHALYPHNFAGTDNALLVNRLFVELYADTATYRIGRHDSHFGLGAILNSGEETWDRFNSIRDGITLDVRLGNFFISPYWGNVNSKDSLTRATKTKEYGVALLYKSIEQDVSFGFLYGKKQNAASGHGFKTGIRINNDDSDDSGDSNNSDDSSDNLTTLGKADVKVTDFYFQKGFGDFGFSVEIPLIDGVMTHLLQDHQEANYKGRGIIFESHYKMNPKWTAYLYAGRVSGDNGSNSSFEAMYLHPNYKIANLMFRYNLAAVSQPDGENGNIYDSYMTNIRYLKLAAEYSKEKWRWNLAFIRAHADTVAQKGNISFNHSTNKRFEAVSDQSNDLGTEVDVNFNYQWNSNIYIKGSLGYLITGEYWSFTNDPNINNTVKDTYALQLGMGIDF